MNMKVQSSRSGKVLGIGELLASACSASAPLDRSLIDINTKAQTRLEKWQRTDHKIMPGTELAAANIASSPGPSQRGEKGLVHIDCACAILSVHFL